MKFRFLPNRQCGTCLASHTFVQTFAWRKPPHLEWGKAPKFWARFEFELFFFLEEFHKNEDSQLAYIIGVFWMRRSKMEVTVHDFKTARPLKTQPPDLGYSLTHSVTATFKFWHKEWLLTLETLQLIWGSSANLRRRINFEWYVMWSREWTISTIVSLWLRRWAVTAFNASCLQCPASALAALDQVVFSTSLFSSIRSSLRMLWFATICAQQWHHFFF